MSLKRLFEQARLMTEATVPPVLLPKTGPLGHAPVEAPLPEPLRVAFSPGWQYFRVYLEEHLGFKLAETYPNNKGLHALVNEKSTVAITGVGSTVPVLRWLGTAHGLSTMDAKAASDEVAQILSSGMKMAQGAKNLKKVAFTVHDSSFEDAKALLSELGDFAKDPDIFWFRILSDQMESFVVGPSTAQAFYKAIQKWEQTQKPKDLFLQFNKWWIVDGSGEKVGSF